MRYGHFDDERGEYVITRPDTPLPWINYLGCQEFFGIISNTAGGYSFYKDARLRRLTRYRYNNVPLDAGGRYIYLREDAAEDASQPIFWSPTWMPTRRPLDEYECRHGLGYTRICSRYAGIEAQTCYFIPLGENLEVWQLTLTNRRGKPADLSVFSAVEFCLWDALDDATNLQRNYSVGEVEVDGGVIYHKTEYRERRDHFAFLACSQPLAGFDTQREAFLGAYRGWDSPQAVETGRMSASLACGWQPIGAQQVKVHLEPGGQQTIIFLLGYQENPPAEKFDPPGTQTINKRAAQAVIARFCQAEQVEAAFQALKRHYDGMLARLQVKTPDAHTNRMVNIWNAYQTIVTFNFSRSASYFETGIGRGMGFRDSNQDLLGCMQFLPGQARQRILDLAATQLPDGGAYHQFQTLTRRGNNDIGSGFNDDPLWLVLSTTAYIKETGDWSLLAAPVPFDNQPGSEAPLLEHLQRSIQYTLERLGPHRLPLIGRADWNDCLNLNCFSESPGQSFQTTTNKDGRVAESVFIAGLFVLAAKQMAELMAQVERRKLDPGVRAPLPSSFYLDAAREMEAATWSAGWDGAWFRRAYDDLGRPLGSQQNEEGRIFIEPQGMCVMAGLGLEDGRAQQALDAVASHLATPQGILLHQPAFSQYYLHLGEISSYPPGYKENAGVFCHTNPWIMIAEARLGRGERALDYYLRINPSQREAISEQHRCEPYVYAQMIAGRDAAAPGEAKNSWLTGAAAWNYTAITQWILGIRPAYEGLEIAPVMPSAWKGFDAVRWFRGVRYAIHVERTGPGNLVQIAIEGRPLAGTLIPLPEGGLQDVQVTVRVG